VTITLGLLDVLIFLLPGFVFFAISNSDRTSIIYKVLPTSGSLTVLGAVPILAIFCHAIWALIFYIQEQAGRLGFPLIEVPFEPNVYKWIYLKNPPSDISSGAILYGLFMILIISFTSILYTDVNGGIMGFLRRYKSFVRPAVKFFVRFPLLGSLIMKSVDEALDTPSPDRPKTNEDWLSYLIRKSEPDDRWLVAYIVTKQETDEGSVGYAGVVEKVGRESDGNISFIVIDDVQSFLLKNTSSGVERIQNDVIGLPTHSFQREDYISLSFEVQTREPIPPTDVPE